MSDVTTCGHCGLLWQEEPGHNGTGRQGTCPRCGALPESDTDTAGLPAGPPHEARTPAQGPGGAGQGDDRGAL